MIFESLLNAVFSVVIWAMDLFQLDLIAWNLDTSKLAPFLIIVRSVLYFLPVDTIASIIGLTVAFGIFRICLRFIRTIWDLLPFI